MAINYAVKYAEKVDERFALQSVTQAAVNDDYDFTGVNTVNVYSIPTTAMNDYTVSGVSRYGTPAELQDTTQSLTMTRDRAFTFTIDRRSYNDTMMTKEAGRALRRQLDEVVIPEVDAWRLSKMAAGAGTVKVGAITSSNAYASFLEGVTALLENKVPVAGTLAFIGSNFYRQIRLDTAFVKNGDLAQQMLVNGQVGLVEGVALVHVPTSYLPADTEFILVNRAAVAGPQKISDYKIHDNPPGINGWLVEGRVNYDAFVLENKTKAIYLHKNK